MSNRIVKQRVVVYKADETPFEMTPYVLDWSIENGGVSGGNSGLDGVVQTASITIKNSAEDSYNFNPEVEMGLPVWNVYTFVGDGTNNYAGVPSGYKKGTASFNRIFGIVTDWDNTPSTWDTFETWTLNDESDYSNLYGEITVSSSNFITPKVIPSGVLFEIACRSVDYSQRNPINTVDNDFVPLLDENVKVEIYTMHEEPSWMSYRWYSDGSNNFTNPTAGTPLIGAIGFMKAVDLEVKSWDDTPATWDTWNTSFDEDTGESDYYTTQVVYDQDTDKIILGKTPDVNTPIDLSISYYTEEPELEFSGFIGDSIAPNPADSTITLTCRDKGKLLQDTMIDGYFIYIDETSWAGFEDVKQVYSINTTSNVVTTVADHGYKVGDPVRFQSTEALPLKYNGDPSPYNVAKMSDVYIVDAIPTSTTFTLKSVDFATTGTGTISLKLYVMDVDHVIQNILDDTRGVNAPTLYTDFPANYNKRIQVTKDIWDSKTCWDAIQHIASMKALYLSFVFNDTTQDFELILKTIEDKTTADFALTQSGIYSQTQTSSGTDIRNSILLAYYSSETGAYESVSSVDDDSVNAYGIRPSLITEANTSGINTEELAQDLADRVLDASKDKIVESILTLPLTYKDDTHGRINVGDTVSVDYKYLDNQENGDIPFFAIESYRHSFSAGATESSGRFMTEFRGNRKKVRTGKRRFKDIESRPGEFTQQKGRDLGERYSIPVVENIEIADSGLESIALSPRAYAVISWNRPANYFPSHFILEWRKSDDNPDYSTGEQRKIISTTSDIYSERINLDPKTEYKFRLTSWSRGNVQGVISDETVIDEIGDSVAPNMPSPSGLSVVGLDEGLQISFNSIENTDTGGINSDFLAYNIYIKKGSPPTTSVYDYKKTTQSTTTVFSGLGLEPGGYYVGITGYDTSGNESSISNIVNVDTSPKLIIRTQDQFDDWINEVGNYDQDQYYPDYETVIIYKKSTPYIFSNDYTNPSSNRYDKSFRITSESFSIIGIGEPTIQTYSYPYEIRIKLGQGSITGIVFESYTPFGLNVEGDSTLANSGTINILNNHFDSTNGRSLGSVEVPDDIVFTFENNKLTDQSLYCLLDDSGVEGRLIIRKNKFLNNGTAISGMIGLDLFSGQNGVLSNVTIDDNYIKNGSIFFQDTQPIEYKNIKVINNEFEDTISKTDAKIEFVRSTSSDEDISLVNSYFDNNNIKNSSASEFILFDDDSKVTSQNTIVNVSISNNNSDNSISWLDISSIDSLTELNLSKNKPSSTETENSTTNSTATAGSQTLPSNPVGFIEKIINGTLVKIPYYAN